MNFTDEIKNNHRKLSRCNADFLAFAEKNQAALKASSFFPVKSYQGEASVLNAWPTFINQQFRHHIEEVAVGIFQLIRSLPQRIFGNNAKKIAKYYNLPLDAVFYSLSLCNPGYVEHLFGRGDFALTESGLKCMEYNIASNLGGTDLTLWEPLYLATPIIQDFIKEYCVHIRPCRPVLPALFEHLAQAAKQLLKPRSLSSRLNIALLMDTPDDLPSFPHQNNLAQYTDYEKILATLFPGAQLKGNIFTCRLNQLTEKDNHLYYKDHQVAVLVDLTPVSLPLRFVQMAKLGRLVILNGPPATIMVNKANLALLSEHQNSTLFTPREQRLIQEVVPWTRKLQDTDALFHNQNVSLPEFTRSNRDKLIIKPTIEFGGAGVTVGRYTSQEKWQSAVYDALDSRACWLVQEFIETLPMMYQTGEKGCVEHDSVWGLFVFGQQYVDGMMRVMPRAGTSGVVNAKQGATVSKVIEVNELEEKEQESFDDDLAFDFS